MFKGSYVAIVTPFKNGGVDFEALGRLIDFQIENGTAGIVPCGTTGESATLSEEEHRKVIEFTVKQVAGRVQVIAGTGSNCTATAIELTKHAKEAGADAALIITPYYNKPTQTGLSLHFSAIAEAVDIPIVLYNVPGRTGVNMLPSTVAELAGKHNNIVALKDATGSLEQACETLAAINDSDFDLLSGEDAMVFPLLSVGAKGVISVFANIAPSAMSGMIKKFFDGDISGARDDHYKNLPACKAMFLETNPIPVKTALGLMGMCSDSLRLPMNPMNDATKEQLKGAIKNFGLIS